MVVLTESFEDVVPGGNVGFFAPYYQPGLLTPYTFKSGKVQLVDPLGGLAVVGEFDEGDANFGTTLAAGDVPDGSAYLALDTDTGLLRLKFVGTKVYTVGAYVNTKSGDDPAMAIYDKKGKLITATPKIPDVPFSDWDSNYLMLVSKKPIAQVAFVGAFVAVDDLRFDTSKAKLVKGTGGNDNLTPGCSNKSEYVDCKGGNDKVNAKGGNDTVSLGDGKNKANGGDGNDSFICSGGREKLTGGDGNDCAVVTSLEGQIKWMDFNPIDNSFAIELSALSGVVAGILNPNAFFIGAAAADSNDRLGYDPLTGEVLFERDGVGGLAPVTIATVSPGLAPNSSHFVIWE